MLSARGAPLDRTAAVRRVLIALLVANLAVGGAKLGIGLVSHSLAVLGDALHSTVDALNNVLALVIDSQNSNTIYAGTGRGVFRSRDGGQNWMGPRKSIRASLLQM